METTAIPRTPKGSLRTLRTVLAAGGPPYAAIGVAIGIALIDVAATLAFPVVSKTIVDSMSSKGFAMGSLWSDPRLVLLFFLLVLGAIAGGVSGYLLSRAGLTIGTRLKARLFGTTIARPIAYFDRSDSGEIVSRFVSDTRNISGVVTKNLAGLVEGILLLVGSLVLLLMLDVALTAMIFAVILTTFAVMAPIVLKTSKITAELNDSNAALSGTLTRVFGEMRLMKAFTAERFESRRMDEGLGKILKGMLRLARIESALGPANGLALSAAMLLIFGYGGARVAAGTLSIGTLTAFILYIFNIVAPLIQLSVFLSQFQAAIGSSVNLAEMLDAPEEAPAGPVAATMPRLAGTLRFEGVRFAYDDEAEPFLDLDGLCIAAGARTAIVGPSGGGKTTIFSLIERFYDPQCGRITLDGIDIRRFGLREWRSQIGFVPQASTLISGSVLDNICYGDDRPAPARAWKAALAANCGDFLKSPADLDRFVGENGSLLSGGQKQRVAIARIFYRDPQLLLLDEATSNLDETNEGRILDALDRLMAGRTTVLITHRLSILGEMDHVVTLERGHIVTAEAPRHGRHRTGVALEA
jgi:ATP-binding cassette, subfamily B, bacterial AbcA/BmrA